MSLVNSPFFLASTGAAETAGSSLRFEDGDSAYLSRTPASAGNTKTWTWSGWVKRGNLGTSSYISLFGAVNGTLNSYIAYNATYQALEVGQGATAFRRTSAVFRDVSAWYHVVVASDTTQATASNRLKIYINNEEVTSFSATTDPTQNSDWYINNTLAHAVGAVYPSGSAGYFFDGYLANVTLIDGQQLDPTSFGEYEDTLWKPKSDVAIQALTFGTNGFYLPFKQTTEAEGFSTVTYSGSGADHSIEGVGFEPDLVWIKNRTFGTANNSYSHTLFDSVRGVGRYLNSNETSAESAFSASFSLTSFDDNGFSISDGGTLTNASGSNFVAWCWDAGDAQNWAADFDGSDDDVTGTLSSAIGTGDFTLEYWVRHDTLTDYQTHFSITRGAGGFNVGTDASGDMVFYSSSSRQLESIGAISAGTWYHFAFVRNSGTLKGYVDGVELDSVANTTNFSATAFSIGALDSTNEFANCRISNLRLTNTAVYTAAFTPPTSNLTAISGTILLTLQDGSFKDNSGNNTVVTGNNGVLLAQNNNNSENTDGSITSTVKANTANGFSIVSYTGNGTNGATVGHGLNQAPDLWITKNRSSGTADWLIKTSSMASNEWLRFKTDALLTNLTNNSANSTVITTGGNTVDGNSGDSYVCYAFHSVSGYSDFGSYTGTGAAGNAVTTGFKPAFVMIKRTDIGDSWGMFDNTRDTNNPNDQLLYAERTDAESTNTFGAIDFNSNGFTVNGIGSTVNNSGGTYIYMAFADTRDATFFGDTSGNGNNWTPNKLNNTDVVPDSPVTNFPTLNPLTLFTSNTSLAEGSLKANASNQGSGSNWGSVFSTFNIPTTGKYYVEGLAFINAGSGNNSVLGVVDTAVFPSTNRHSTILYSFNTGEGFDGVYISLFNNNAQPISDGVLGTSVGGLTGTTVLAMLAIDVDNGKVWAGYDGTWLNSGNPAAGTGEIATRTFSSTDAIAVGTGYNGSNDQGMFANFGQDSSFAGLETPQGNTDDNGQGDFYYAPPSGFLALNRNNLPTPDILDPADYFNTLLYTGTGSSLSVTGANFQPDWTWIKKRSGAENHALYDVVRGTTNRLQSNVTTAENTGGLTSFDSDGFTVDGAYGTDGENGATYAAWNWLAGGTAVSNTDGSITSQVNANTDAGFSIVSYVADGTNTSTVGHGLLTEPKMVIQKNRSAASDWLVYTDLVDGSDDYLLLNSTAAYGNAAGGATATVFNSWDRTSGNNMIAYCFSEIEGYSKIGKYTGNGSANGPYVHLGFRPSFFMLKAASRTGRWITMDNKRDEFNVSYHVLSPNGAQAEDTNTTYWLADFLSNGIKLRYGADTEFNQSGQTYIFMAFAEAPFKNANAR